MPQRWRMQLGTHRFYYGAGRVPDGFKETSTKERWKTHPVSEWFTADAPQDLARARHCRRCTLSCTYVPTDLYAAWCCIKGFPVDEGQLALEGVTAIQIENGSTTECEYMHNLPKSLKSLKFDCNQSLEGVTLPSSLHSLTFGASFNQSLEWVALPTSLQRLTFSCGRVERPRLPSSVQSLTFGHFFNQSLEGVSLPSSLQSLTFGASFNQSLEGVSLPSSLQSLTFGASFNHRACKEWRCQAIFRTWHLDTILTRACKEWACQAAFKAWHLAWGSTRPCKEWTCQAIFRTWHLAWVSTRPCKKWTCQAAFKAWHLVPVSTRACKEWPLQVAFSVCC